MRKVLRGYAKAKDGNLSRERKDKRHLVRQGATIFKREMVS